jgi:hypothetical protein
MKVRVYTADGRDPFDVEGDHITLVNNSSYGPVENFIPREFEDEAGSVVLLNAVHAIAIEQLD